MSYKLLFAGLGVLAACQRAPEPGPAASGAPGDALAALQAQYGARPQYFTYSPQRVDVFRTAGGGALATGSQAFLDIASSSPAAGPLRLEVREVLTRADMVLSGIPSMADNTILESAGHYLVQASTADHQLLWLSPRVKLGLAVGTPPQLTSPYGLFVYQPTQPGNPRIVWQLAADTASSVNPSVPLAPTDPIYLRCLIGKGLYDTNGGWLSFAHPLYSRYQPTTVRVHTSEPAAAENSAVYLVFRDYNAVAQFTPLGKGDFTLANVPSQAAVTVFALYSASGKLLLGQRTDTVRVGGPPLAIPLAEHTAEEVAAAARLLN